MATHVLETTGDIQSEDVVLLLEPIPLEESFVAEDTPLKLDYDLDQDIEGHDFHLHLSSDSNDTIKIPSPGSEQEIAAADSPQSRESAAATTGSLESAHGSPASRAESTGATTPPHGGSRPYSRASYNADQWHSRQFLQAQNEYRGLMETQLRLIHNDLGNINATSQELGVTLQQVATVGAAQKQLLAQLVDRQDRQNVVLGRMARVGENLNIILGRLADGVDRHNVTHARMADAIENNNELLRQILNK
ncbi:uncharacterized protein [Hyperolius riggenbachi]|uniref:uncharacterized protein isoform X1 n=1 Tax=Hyperolius riggenbachi TaxID=752182 RepID=UPI0035A3CDA9